MHSVMATSTSKPALAPVGGGGSREREEKEGGTPSSPSSDRGTTGSILWCLMHVCVNCV